MPAPATADILENAAARYVARYASSAESLRRVLMRRVERSVRDHGTDRTAGAQAVEAIVARYVEVGLVDDASYAEAFARRLHRRGVSPTGILARLAEKGVAREVAQTALDSLCRDVSAPELAAACHLVRRRRLGPFRPEDQRAGRREKDLAALARAGYSLSVARRVIDAETAEEVKNLCENPEEGTDL